MKSDVLGYIVVLWIDPDPSVQNIGYDLNMDSKDSVG